jgi:alkanesulfonate monooxygenase SsuD/methylene tetrahydromethanopterin reductase-like flavin-dependent oxidoreductase (luciferase family)
MRVGAILSPVGDWQAILESAKIADAGGLDAVGFWDHYHSEKPEWAYVCGWSAYGMLAAATKRIKLTPMVICRLNYTLGVLAKESALLAIVSGGRFELGIGAGDYPIEYSAWHQPFPDATTRVETLEETIAALRLIWQGGAVTYSGKHVQLTDAACTPAPPLAPRVVAGVGGSRRMIRSAVAYADELNLYGDEELVKFARVEIAKSGRAIDLSVAITWEQWPDDVRSALAKWEDLGISRTFVTMGFYPDMIQRVAELADVSKQ